MALRDIDIEGAMRLLADRRIEEAMREGKFDNIAGMGEPIADLENAPAQEDARMTWWALRILKNNDIVPDEVRWRKQLDALKAELNATKSDSRVRFLVSAINRLVHRINTLGVNALKAPVIGVDLEEELRMFGKRFR